MIDRDMQQVAAESRPMIMLWLCKAGIVFGVIILPASSLTLFAVIRQISQSEQMVAVKPQGDSYDVTGYKDIDAAVKAAARAR